ncbi:hypothetical protein AB1Y20_014615 [Prymnesium parvum]|uniref:tRNA pseudouridine synthase n=1 Tax=Prymnesium parvum TaxID=97485 RepID=A0AB34ICT1_PRYPA|mmetsp:Transcript_12948/g.30840  ORF Transcript_12948/g.30840 Transcript_12948/m.30840 type:complete len:303 (+) Transcript_12948:30-938(+)
MVKVALSVAYDGTSFRGWTDVRDSTLRPTLSRLLRQSELPLEVASRTDAGVHAFGNVCSFSCASPPRDLAQLTYSLNQLLPPEVCVTQISLPPPDFDVRETVGKEYRYHVNFAPRRQPLTRLYEWQVPARRGALAWDGASAAHAASLMLGRHSFAAFGNTPRGKERRAPVDASCALQMLQLRQLTPTVVQFRVRGDRFLYKMVRNIVGALVRVGQGELEHEELLHALESGRFERSDSLPITAPAHGLVLHSIMYARGNGPFDCHESLRAAGVNMQPDGLCDRGGGLRPWRVRAISSRRRSNG